MSRAEWILLALVAAAGATAVNHVLTDPSFAPPPLARTDAQAIAAPPPPEPPRPATPAPEPTTEITASRTKLGQKFCADGGDETFTITFTLAGWLQDHESDPSADRLRPLVQRAIDARAKSDVIGFRDASRAAFELDASDPAIAWAVADAYRNGAEPALAAKALGVYLAKSGDIPALSRLKARLEVAADIQREFVNLENSGVTLLHPKEGVTPDQADRLLRRTLEILDEGARVLSAPRRRALTVVLYPGREEVLAVTCVREWAEAVYDGTLRVALDPKRTDLVGDGVVRHEAMHAALADVTTAVPFWFNEGLAQWFAHEQPRVKAKWELMKRNKTYIPFSSLDATFQAFDNRDDAALAYAQSLAMVDWIVASGGESALARAVPLFRGGATTQQVMNAMVGPDASGAALLDHLR